MKAEEVNLTVDNINITNSALKSIGDGLIITDVLGRIKFMNKKAEILTKYNNEDCINRLMSEIFVIHNIKKNKLDTDIHLKAIESGRSIGLSSNDMLVNRLGEKLFISASVAPIMENEDVISGSITIFRDISRVKNKERELRKYSEVFKQNPSSIIITDLKWNIEYINHLSPDLKGNHDSFDKAKNIDSIFMNQTPVNYDEIEELIKKGKSWEKEISYLGEDNQINYICLTVNCIYDEDNKISNYVITKEDITKRKEAERQLSLERENFASIFYVSPFGLLTVGEDAIITRANDAACHILRKNKDDMVGKRFCEGVNCDKRCKKTDCPDICRHDCENLINHKDCIIKDCVNKALKFNRTIKGVELKHYIKDEKDNPFYIWLRVSVVPVLVNERKFAMVVFEDITSNKIMADTLIENEERLRLITDNMNDLVIQVNSKGIVRYISPSVFNLLGYTPEFAMRKNVFDYIHPEDLEKSYGLMNKRLSTNSNFVSEIRMKSKSHGYYWFEVSGNIFTDNDGEPYIVYVCRDVSEKREVINQIKHAKEEAIAANNAKSEFLANMSHEIRTPMNGIIGMTNLTLMTDLTEEQQENLVLVKNSAESLLQIVNEILDFSKIEAGKVTMDIIDFEPVLQISRLLKNFRSLAHDKKLNMNVHIDHNLPIFMRGDSNKIRQVLNNLISNAIKFTEEGEINIGVTIIGESHNGLNVEFSVKDTGIGIKESDFNKIFSSFSQADGSITRTYGGTGLGLSISKQLVELMGGKIGFSSKINNGSEFSFVVPMEYSRKEKNENIDIKIEIPVAKVKSKLLLVEDDRVNRVLARTILEKHGHKVILANNGKEALALLEEHVFDLILMDIEMPEMGGVEATSIIRTNPNTKDIPIIALTAHTVKGDRERFMALGMDDYISKPMDIDLLFNILKKHLNKEEKARAFDELSEIQSEIEKLTKGGSYSEENNEIDLNPDEYANLINDLEGYVHELEGHISEKNYFNIERTAHFMKSIASAGGFMKVRKIAFKIEMSSRKKDMEQIEIIYEKLIGALRENILKRSEV